MKNNPLKAPRKRKTPDTDIEPSETVDASQGAAGGVEEAITAPPEERNLTKPDTEVVIPEVVDVKAEDQERTRVKKKAFLETFVETMGGIKETCGLIDISRQTFYEWRHNDAAFRQALLDCEAQIIEDAEGMLGFLVRKGHAPSVHFLLQARTEKYKPRQKIEGLGSSSEKTFEDVVDELAKDLFIERTGKPYADGRDNTGNTLEAHAENPADTEQAQRDSSLPAEHGPEVLLGEGEAPQHNPEG